jgi:hypothetical protein
VTLLRSVVGRIGMIVTDVTAARATPLIDEIVLPPLDRRRALRLIRRTHPQLSAEEHDRLVAAAEGNPLLLTHLVSGGSVSPTLRAAVTDRLLSSPPDTLDELGKLALRGAPVARVHSRSCPRPRSDHVTRDPTVPIWFVHDLFAETVLELLDEPRLTTCVERSPRRCHRPRQHASISPSDRPRPPPAPPRTPLSGPTRRCVPISWCSPLTRSGRTRP